jgi:AcrR family transcriptional regulator
MAPKLKVMREQVIEAGLEIARECGIEAITARELGLRLGLSSRPTYSFFSSIDELKQEVVKKIYDIFSAALQQRRDDTDPFLRIGLNHIEFARTNKEFYQIIHSTGHKYIKEHKKNFQEMMVDNLRQVNDYAGFTNSEMEDLFLKMGIFSHGLADMLYQSGDEKYDDSFICKLMQETGQALIKSIPKKNKK